MVWQRKPILHLVTENQTGSMEALIKSIFSEAGIAWAGWALFAAYVWIANKDKNASHKAATDALLENAKAMEKITVILQERLK